MSDARILAGFVKEAIAMSQDLLDLLSLNRSCPIQYCCIGFRFLRYKFYPWITLAIAPLNILVKSGVNRIHEKNRYMSAISKIDFAGVYALLNELLW
jgi:hypothetical protein